MGSSHGKKRAYDIAQPPGASDGNGPRKGQLIDARACARAGVCTIYQSDLNLHARPVESPAAPRQRRTAAPSAVTRRDGGGRPGGDGIRDHGDVEDLIKPSKLLNPVKSSRSHQELHRELMSSCRRSGFRVESAKPELQRVLDARRRDQIIGERKREEEARRKISPLEAELRKRQRALQEMELMAQQDERRDPDGAPEFLKVKENLRRTSRAALEDEPV
ncbi:protein FAM107B-like [Stigmatopora nigra]